MSCVFGITGNVEREKSVQKINEKEGNYENIKDFEWKKFCAGEIHSFIKGKKRERILVFFIII